MAAIHKKLIFTALNRAYGLVDSDIQNNLDKQHEFRKQTILVDESLTKDEKSEAIRMLNIDYDYFKILFNEGTKRTCENCWQESLATLYCEHCVRNYLNENFSNWTSGNNDVDNLIQECQIETFRPDSIVEWISYNNLRNIKYLTKGGFSKIYTADWFDGHYIEWDSKKQQLKRSIAEKVVIKKFDNVESANRSWFEEAKSHLTISNKYSNIVQCYGLTQDQKGNYGLVMRQMDIYLRKYLQKNHNKLIWKERIHIIYNIISSLSSIHKENAIHRDLHSGNILYSQNDQRFFISDFGFCGPPDKPLKNVYGVLSYIAPEVIAGKETTFASDIYSIAMLMWEISSGKPPFNKYQNDYNLAFDIINGMRPKIVPGTPLEYESLMRQCWDANPTKRPDTYTLYNKIRKINNTFQSSKPITNDNYKLSSLEIKLLISRLHQQCEDFPEPKNATEEEQEVFHSKPYNFFISDGSNNLSNNTSKSSGNKKYNVESENLLDSTSRHGFFFSDNNDVNSAKKERKSTQNYTNFHSNEQNKLEISEEKLEDYDFNSSKDTEFHSIPYDFNIPEELEVSEEFHYKPYNFDILEVQHEDFENLDTVQFAQLEKEISQFEKEKLTAIVKYMDNVERAYRKEEIPLLEKDYVRQKKADKAAHRLKLETVAAKHDEDLKVKARLMRILPDYKKYQQEIKSKRFEEFEQRRRTAHAKIEEDKEKRRQLYRAKKEEERKRREMEEEARREVEECKEEFQESVNIINKIQITNRKRFNDSHIYSNVSSATLSISDGEIEVVTKELQYDKSNLELIKTKLDKWIKGYEHNIIRFLGIFKDKQKLFLVIPFANEGNLRDYLKNKKSPFINKKIEIAMNITNGIKYLHDNDIVHGNLHSKNILLFDEIARISDLPLPSITNEAMYFEEKDLFDNIGYIDPESILNENFKKNKSMDIYSLGSLLWEIASEKVLYLKDQEDSILQLVLKIKDNGYREEDIADIPAGYVDLYKRCWDGNSSNRPTIENVYEILSKIKSIKSS